MIAILVFREIHASRTLSPTQAYARKLEEKEQKLTQLIEATNGEQQLLSDVSNYLSLRVALFSPRD